MIQAYHYTFLYACIGVTLLVAFFTIGVPNTNAVGASIACYYLVAAAVLILAGQSAATITNLSSGLVKMLPFLSIFGIVMYSGILMSVYFDQIASNQVSEYYYNFSKVSIILIMIQMGVFLRALYSKGVDNISRQTMAILGLLGTVNLITVITLGITLKYYTTDC
jgi:hypothetical protein